MMARWWRSCALIALAACHGDREAAPIDAPIVVDSAAPDAPGGVAVHGFRRYTIDPHADGPAYARVATIAGKPAVVVSAFGHPTTRLTGGTVTAYTRGASLDAWTATPIVATADDVIFPNEPTIADVDGDGDDDVIVPSGFLVCAISFIPGAGPCGAIAWHEQTPTGWVHHPLISKQDDFYHHVELVDLDGDHRPDLVTTGEFQPFNDPSTAPRAELQVIPGTATAARFATAATTLAQGGGSFPRVADLDGDGDLDVASAQFFVHDASFVWFEHDGAAWTRHVIGDADGPAIELALVPDLTGDGHVKALGTNHVNTAKDPPDPEPSAVVMFDVPADPHAAWARHVISEGIVSRAGDPMAPLGAPGIFGVGDLDHDGDLDIAVSGDGDAHVYWLEQTTPGHFVTHVLEDQLGQAGGMTIADLDGDGRAELVVTGYEDDVIYVYAYAGGDS